MSILTTERAEMLAEKPLRIRDRALHRYSEIERAYSSDLKDIDARAAAEPPMGDFMAIGWWIQEAQTDIEYLIAVVADLRARNTALASTVRGGAHR